MVKDGTRSISDLAEPFKMSLAAVSKHIKILESAKLLKREKIGRVNECTFNPEALTKAEECIQFYTQFWGQGLNAFADELAGKNKKSKRRK